MLEAIVAKHDQDLAQNRSVVLLRFALLAHLSVSSYGFEIFAAPGWPRPPPPEPTSKPALRTVDMALVFPQTPELPALFSHPFFDFHVLDTPETAAYPDFQAD